MLRPSLQSYQQPQTGVTQEVTLSNRVVFPTFLSTC